ncbi:unnamed protein product [marine sediment metagenome]|uniref:MmgE/PrpD N-terminal domain-containing protein n=1 Tax=marine sediment metagenome TaxID=412755 RepID=X1J2C4_9ZZZZ
METIGQKWAKFALELNYKNIPSVALDEAKRFLLDSVGCAFSALDNKDTQAAYNYIQDLGGKEQATIICPPSSSLYQNFFYFFWVNTIFLHNL